LGNGRDNRASRNGSSKRTPYEEFVREDAELEREMEDALSDLDKVAKDPDGESESPSPPDPKPERSPRHPQRA
jgi:hypothetical protein